VPLKAAEDRLTRAKTVAQLSRIGPVVGAGERVRRLL